MKIRLLFLFTFLSFVAFGQETPPTPGANFKQLSTSQFWISLPDSAVWQYKGSTYGWQKTARYSDIGYTKIQIDSLLAYKESLSNKQNSLLVDGTGIKYPTVDAINESFGINESLIAYIDTAGNNSTAIIGNSRKPYQSIEAALDALPIDRMVLIKIGIGNFNAPPKTKLRDNIIYKGSSKPITNSTITIVAEGVQPIISNPTKLINGTIIKGSMFHVNKKNVKVFDLGIDAGLEWCNNFNSGIAAEGLIFSQYYDPNGGQSGDDGTHPLQTESPPVSGVEIQNVAVLTKDNTSPVHCVLMENLYAPKATNVSTYFGMFGFVSKSFGGNFSNFDLNGHSFAGAILKSNDYAYNSFLNISNVYATSIGSYDGAGIVLQGEEGTSNLMMNLSNIQFAHTKFVIHNVNSISGANISNVNAFDVLDGIAFNGNVSYINMTDIAVRGHQNEGMHVDVTGSNNYISLKNILVSGSGGVGFALNATGTGSRIDVDNLRSIGDANAYAFFTNIYGTNIHKSSGTTVGTISNNTGEPTDEVLQMNADGNIAKSGFTIAQIAFPTLQSVTTNGAVTDKDILVERATGNPSVVVRNGSGGDFPLLALVDERTGATSWNIENGRTTLGRLELYSGVSGTVYSFTPSGYPTAVNDVLRYTDLGTGWAQYTDNAYTSVAPLIVNAGTTSTIGNNSATALTSQLPIGVTSFYNSSTSKITPENNGDSYLINVRFTAESSSVTGLCDVGIDIGGAMNIVSQETVSLRKGVGNSQRVNIVFDVFSGSTFLSNGGLIKLTSIDGNTSIYDISYKITRTHKAK